MRTHLLTTVAAVALLAALPAHAQDATWLPAPATGIFNTATNWNTGAVPTGTASFGASNVTSLSFSTTTAVGGFTFNAGAPLYTFTNNFELLSFIGAGIVNGGSATINNTGGVLDFHGTSTADSATINNSGGLVRFFDNSTAGNAALTTIGNQIQFFNNSTAGNARIMNNNEVFFSDNSKAGSASITDNGSANIIFQGTSTADSATITHNSNGTVFFTGNSSGGTARLIVNAGAVDFSGLTSIGTTAGSFEGPGTFFLGSKTITVGGNNLSTTVSGIIQDGGFSGGAGGSLVKVGTGILTLSGTNIYTGSTTVNAGALIVNGSIGQSSLTTVNSGAALIGSGTVGSTVVNTGGFLVPGPVGTPGTMTIAGNLAFQSGAFYVVQVNPTTASNTNVSGTASLAGTVGAIFFPGTYMVHSYPIVTTGGGVSGTFNNLLTVGLPTNFQTSLSYTANTAFLNLRAQLVPEPTPPPPPPPSSPPPDPPDPVPPLRLAPVPLLPTFTVNQLNVGHAIDNFFNNGGALPPAFVSVFNLTGSNLTTALDQLSGEAATGAQKVAFQLTDQFLGLMLDPFVDGRCGIGRTDYPPLGFARDCETRPSALGFAPERETMPPEIALAYASVLKEPRASLAPVYEPRWTAWAGAYGGSNRTSGDIAITGSHDLSASTVGGAAGLDYHLTPDSVVGFALGGGGTNWSLSQGLGGGKSDAFQAGLYGATRWGPAYLAADFAFTNHWMSTDRTAVGDHLTADFNAQSYGGRLEGGYRFGMLYGGITPYAAIQAQSFHTPAFTETDVIANGFGLAFGSRDATDTRSELGTRFDRVLAVYSNAVLALRGRVAWAHDWVSDATLMPVFQSLPGASFIVNGATLPKNSALTSAGAELRLANGVTLLAKFDGDFASHSSTYGGTGTFRYRW